MEISFRKKDADSVLTLNDYQILTKKGPDLLKSLRAALTFVTTGEELGPNSGMFFIIHTSEPKEDEFEKNAYRVTVERLLKVNPYILLTLEKINYSEDEGTTFDAILKINFEIEDFVKALSRAILEYQEEEK